MSRARSAVLLMYHDVVERPRRTYDVSCREFERHCGLLASEAVISLEALLKGQAGVSLSFDDGFASCLSAVAPRMIERGWSATAYVTTGYLGRSGYLHAHELRALSSSGFVIGAHGHSHRALTSLHDDELSQELCRSRALLEDAIGAPVVHMALPGGKGDRRVAEAAREAGFRSIATSWPGVVSGAPHPYRLPRVALRRCDRDGEFAQILARSPAFLLKTQARELGAEIAPRFLSRRVYDFIRSARRALLRTL